MLFCRFSENITLFFSQNKLIKVVYSGDQLESFYRDSMNFQCVDEIGT